MGLLACVCGCARALVCLSASVRVLAWSRACLFLS